MLRNEFGKDNEVKEIIYIFQDEKVEKLEKEINKLKEDKLKAIEKNN